MIVITPVRMKTKRRKDTEVSLRSFLNTLRCTRDWFTVTLNLKNKRVRFVFQKFVQGRWVLMKI